MKVESLASNEIWNMLGFFSRNGGVWHVRVQVLADKSNASEKYVQELLIKLYQLGLVSLKTWSKAAWREVSYNECLTEYFFDNRDDANYVRVTPLFNS